MSGLGRVVVGYRANDRRRLELIDRFGVAVVPVRNCVAGCGYPVYFTPSGIDAARTRDAEVICDQCYQAHKAEIQAVEL